MTRPRVASLFSGIGGFDLAFDLEGYEIAGACEIDPHARSIFARHFPDVPLAEDVRELCGDAFGEVDVITFGSPCQDLSVAGSRGGFDAERSGLFREAIRYAHEHEETYGRPAVTLWENVPGAFSSNGGADFREVLASLVGGEVRDPARWRDAGVAFGPRGSAEWRVLNTQYFGPPQRRRRVFALGRPRAERAGEVLLEREGVPGDPPPREEAREDARPVPRGGVAGAMTGSLGTGGPDLSHADAGYLVPAAATLTARHADAYSPEDTFVATHDGKTADCLVAKEGETYTSEGTNFRLRNVVAFAQNPRDEVRRIGGDGDSVGALAASPGAKQQSYLAFAIRGREGGAAAEPTGDVASSIRGEGGSSRDYLAIPNGVRRLTPTECERLQGFPDGWTALGADGEEIADTNRYRVLGNAVSVPVARWIARRLRRIL